MAGAENLVSLADRTTEEQREIARKGGIASQRAQREKREQKKTIASALDPSPRRSSPAPQRADSRKCPEPSA